MPSASKRYWMRPAGVLAVGIIVVLSGSSAHMSSDVPFPWTSSDVGDVGVAGGASYADDSGNPVFTVTGAGADIWGTADSFHFVHRPITGDTEFTARVLSVQNTHVYAKAGLMIRPSLDPGAAGVILDVKPDGGIEFMLRSSTGAQTEFIAGGSIAKFPVSLRLRCASATVNSIVTAFVAADGETSWTQIGFVTVPTGAHPVAGLAVTSHDRSVLNTSTFDRVTVVTNLLAKSGFEEYAPPNLGTPGWVSDNPLRQIVAKSETNQPHQSSSKNGACWATTSADCGMYEEVVAPETGNYIFSVFANADRPGGLVGVNVSGVTAGSRPVPVRSFGNYGVDPLQIGFPAHAGDVIRVWMYSPATPGFVVIDDARLARDVGPI